LRVEGHQLALARRDANADRQAERLQLVNLAGMVVRPGARREQARDLGRAPGRHVAPEQAPGEPLDLRDRLASPSAISSVWSSWSRALGHGHERRGGVLAELRVDGSERRVRASTTISSAASAIIVPPLIA